jgi:hypothetical protein
MASQCYLLSSNWNTVSVFSYVRHVTILLRDCHYTRIWIGNWIWWTVLHTAHDYILRITVTQTSRFTVWSSLPLLGNGFRLPTIDTALRLDSRNVPVHQLQRQQQPYTPLWRLREIVKVILLPTVSRRVSPDFRPPYRTSDQFFFSFPLKGSLDDCWFLIMGGLFDERTDL